MIEIRQTNEFHDWLTGLKDARAKQKIATRVRRMAFGNMGDVKPVGAGVSEMRIDEGAGYRVYFIQRGKVVVVLLCGGTKKRQQADIENAKALAQEWKG
ncbi:type II toxin-antitoxin system RelE/ParE family toxin [Celeribacter neptunius]|uniref:Putative addiction module killer protein n=1 Tax=Celeribacter neptunius TaxID=588602 RepID=A0A1I3TV58_9RHOB|nr:type II toxin-antitoxin system RelE/ParE family toxin [Celeribacter neptunius]SFJ75148.1 putative addiction module killer protein [Celeribacter neptunius]